MGKSDWESAKLVVSAQRWVVRINSGDMTERELLQFQQWVAEPSHLETFGREMAKWRVLGGLQEGLVHHISLPSPATVRHRRIARWTQMGSALTVIATVLTWATPDLLLRARADHIAGASITRVKLADGSDVILDAGSAIATKIDERQREVILLRGRAWFKISHRSGPRFEVKAGDGVIQDIGTAFEVDRTTDAMAQTTVSQGRVRLLSPGNNVLELSAGQRARFSVHAAPARLGDVPVRHVADWRTGNIVLEGVSVRNAISEVARYKSAPVFIWGDVRAHRSITAVLRSDRPDAALSALAASEDLTLTRLPAGIIIVRQRLHP